MFLTCCDRGAVSQAEITTQNPVGAHPDAAAAAAGVGGAAAASATNNPAEAADSIKTVSYSDGSTYRGQVDAMGRRQGHGIWTSSAGSYEGQWRDDWMHGNGKQTWPDRRTYVGSFVKGKFEGFGRMEWIASDSGKMVYEGEYQDDRKHGKGKFVWPDGRTYDGDWRQGRRHGEAVYTNASGETKKGRWKADKLVEWLVDN